MELGNRISVIQSYAFSGLNSLGALKLRGQRLHYLGYHTFTGISGAWTIDSIDLRCSEIATVDDYTFYNVEVQSKLNMRFNSITTLPASVFEGLSFDAFNDGILILCYNPMQLLPKEIFANHRNRAVDVSKIAFKGIYNMVCKPKQYSGQTFIFSSGVSWNGLLQECAV